MNDQPQNIATAKAEMPTALLRLPTKSGTDYAARIEAAGGVVLDLFGEIGPDKAMSLAGLKMQLLQREPDGGARRIHLKIDSFGGDFGETIRIYSFLRNQTADVSAEIGSQCGSGAVLIMLAAAYRTCKSNSTILIHCVRAPKDSIKSDMITARYLRARAEQLECMDSQALDIMTARTGQDRVWFEEQIKTEDAIDAFQALERGLVHEIDGVTMRCDPRWIEQSRLIPRNVIFPARNLNSNYYAACRAALPRTEMI